MLLKQTFVFLVFIAACGKNLSTTAPCQNPVNNQIQQMLNPIVHIKIPIGYTGSGIIFNRKDNYVGRKADEYKYFVLTNNHVVAERKSKQLIATDGLRGRTYFQVKDNPVCVTVFSDRCSVHKTYSGKIIIESTETDLAIITFESTDLINAKVIFPSTDMIKTIDIFDPVLLVSCQFGYSPFPTSGILSAITTHQQGYPIYISDVGTAPGSSGGGLFKKYGEDYCVIAVAQGVENRHQIFPHIGYFIPVTIILEFLELHKIGYGVVGVNN